MSDFIKTIYPKKHNIYHKRNNKNMFYAEYA